MNLTKREQLYALVTGAVLLAALGYFFLLQPYLANRARLINDIQAAQTKFDREQRLLDAREKVAADWKALLAANGGGGGGGTLQTNLAEAIGQAHDTFYDAADNAAAYNARFDLQTFAPDRPRQEGDFQTIRLTGTGTGTTASLSLFVLALERSKLPLRIDDMRITARQPGTDILNFSFNISTLFFSPAPAAPTRSVSQPQPQGGEL